MMQNSPDTIFGAFASFCFGKIKGKNRIILALSLDCLMSQLITTTTCYE